MGALSIKMSALSIKMGALSIKMGALSIKMGALSIGWSSLVWSVSKKIIPSHPLAICQIDRLFRYYLDNI